MPRVQRRPAGLCLRLTRGELPAPPAGGWLCSWQAPDGQTALQFGRSDEGRRLRFPGELDAVISADGSAVNARAAEGISPGIVRHLLLDQILPRVLSHHGRLVLHASASLVREGAVGFVGLTGNGKSTLAASFDRQGYPAVTDDGLVIEVEDVVSCRGTYAGVRLWPDSAEALFDEAAATNAAREGSRKRRLAVGVTDPEQSFPLAALFLLDPPPDSTRPAVEITRVNPSEAVLELLRQSFTMDPLSPEAAMRGLDAACRVAATVPMWRLAYPRDHSLLPHVRAAILEIVSAAPAESLTDNP